MADLPFRIAVVPHPLSDAGTPPPALVAGTRRSWLRPSRPEPFAASISMTGPVGFADEVLHEIESGFRRASRYTVTTSLSRALLAGHEAVRHENSLSLAEHSRCASAVVAAVRPNGLYVARSGAALVAPGRASDVWGTVGRAASDGPSDGSPEMGRESPPQVASELFSLEPGDVLLLVPGITSPTMRATTLSTVLRAPVNLGAVAELLKSAPLETAALVVWWPSVDTADEIDEPWMIWTHSSAERGARTPEQPIAEPEPLEDEPVGRPVDGLPAALYATEEGAKATSRARSAAVRIPGIAAWSRALPLIPLGILAVLAVVLLQGDLPFPGTGDISAAVEDGGGLIQQAVAESDRDASVRQLSQAIVTLDPYADRSAEARALLSQAHTVRDQRLGIVRVANAQRLPLAGGDGFRPAGVWKADGELFILDLGGQLLYRTDPSTRGLSNVLRPGEPVEGHPLGQPVTAAWSPPRGANTNGQLMVVDHTRSVIVLGPDGSVQRWWPPDNASWQRPGPSAATYDDFFLLDSERGEIRRYPARTPGAEGSVVASAAEEPRLASAIDLATDGNLYLLYADGEIAKLAPGSGRLPLDIAIPGRPLTAPVALFAHPDLDRLWVLEPREARVVELTTDGSYVRQYVFPPDLAEDAVALHVDATAGELRLLTPQQVVLVEFE
ncbi:MAG: hypothetical protein GEU73_10340 [Chloroflexi bacterium]|nr:hypothetical protein [Chloroflexota bacterium]